MTTDRMIHAVLCVAAVFVLLAGPVRAQADNGKVKVFILAGQSNMEGKGQTETGNGGVIGAIGSLRYQVNNDPANYGHLGDGAGTWNTRGDVWISSTTDGGEKGDLTVGYGSNAMFGPELGFGQVVGDFYNDQVLLIKTAWGGSGRRGRLLAPASHTTVRTVPYTAVQQVLASRRCSSSRLTNPC